MQIRKWSSHICLLCKCMFFFVLFFFGKNSEKGNISIVDNLFFFISKVKKKKCLNVTGDKLLFIFRELGSPKRSLYLKSFCGKGAFT